MSLKVVMGPMFSGKSTYALSYIRRQKAIGKTICVIKPDIDNRYTDDEELVTHDNERVPCMTWPTHVALCRFQHLNYDCYVIEEAQFFTHLHHFCEELLLKYNKHILVVGLDACAQQKKFGEILDIIPFATSVIKLNAMCSVCRDGTYAPYTKKLVNSTEQVDVGGSEKYIAVCLRHL